MMKASKNTPEGASKQSAARAFRQEKQTRRRQTAGGEQEGGDAAVIQPLLAARGRESEAALLVGTGGTFPERSITVRTACSASSLPASPPLRIPLEAP